MKHLKPSAIEKKKVMVKVGEVCYGRSGLDYDITCNPYVFGTTNHGRFERWYKIVQHRFHRYERAIPSECLFVNGRENAMREDEVLKVVKLTPSQPFFLNEVWKVVNGNFGLEYRPEFNPYEADSPKHVDFESQYPREREKYWESQQLLRAIFSIPHECLVVEDDVEL